MPSSRRALLTAFGLSFALTAATMLVAPLAAQARDVEVTVPATMVIQQAAYPDGNGCVVIAHVMWKADPNAGTSAVVQWTSTWDQQFKESGEEPFDDSDTWVPGLTFRVPAGHHWIRVGASWKNGANETDCSDMEAKSQANVKGAPTVTYTTTEPDPAVITPLGRTVNLNSKGQAAVAIVACPFDGAGTCSVKLPGTTTVSVGGKKYQLSVTGKSTVERGKAAKVYVNVPKQVQRALAGQTIRPEVRITATKPGTKPTQRTANSRSIRIR